MVIAIPILGDRDTPHWKKTSFIDFSQEYELMSALFHHKERERKEQNLRKLFGDEKNEEKIATRFFSLSFSTLFCPGKKAATKTTRTQFLNNETFYQLLHWKKVFLIPRSDNLKLVEMCYFH